MYYISIDIEMKNYEDIAKLFKALSDPHRLRILLLLAEKKLCVCEITEILGLATSTVSNHLSILHEAGLIQQERDGKWMNYYLNPRAEDCKKALFTECIKQLKMCDEAKSDIEIAKKIDRIKIHTR